MRDKAWLWFWRAVGIGLMLIVPLYIVYVTLDDPPTTVGEDEPCAPVYWNDC